MCFQGSLNKTQGILVREDQDRLRVPAGRAPPGASASWRPWSTALRGPHAGGPFLRAVGRFPAIGVVPGETPDHRPTGVVRFLAR